MNTETRRLFYLSTALAGLALVLLVQVLGG